jgi:hypothetical protein
VLINQQSQQNLREAEAEAIAIREMEARTALYEQQAEELRLNNLERRRRLENETY